MIDTHTHTHTRVSVFQDVLGELANSLDSNAATDDGRVGDDTDWIHARLQSDHQHHQTVGL